MTFLHGKGRTVTQVCIALKCTSGSLFLEVWRLDPLKGPAEKTGQPVLRAGRPSVCGARSGSGPPWEPGPLRGLVDAEVAPLVPGFLEAAPQFSGASRLL